MPVSTTSPAMFEGDVANVAELVPSIVPISAPPSTPSTEPITDKLGERFGPPSHGDPSARQRWEHLVQKLTGWQLGASTDAEYAALAASRDEEDEAYEAMMRRRVRDR